MEVLVVVGAPEFDNFDRTTGWVFTGKSRKKSQQEIANYISQGLYGGIIYGIILTMRIDYTINGGSIEIYVDLHGGFHTQGYSTPKQMVYNARQMVYNVHDST